MIRRYAVPGDIFAALAAGGGGEPAMRFLIRTQRSKHLLLLRKVVDTAVRVDHPRATDLVGAYDVLAGMQADRPSEVEPLLTHPPVSAWAMQTLHGLRNRAAVDHGYLMALTASAAVLARASCVIEVPLSSGGNGLFLPFLGRAQLALKHATDVATVRCQPGRTEILAQGARVLVPANPHLDGDGWLGVRRLTVEAAGLTRSFLLDDLDPYRLPGGRTAERLGAVASGQWQQTLADAWTLLVTHHRQIAEEIALGVRVLVPLHADPGREVSATSRHCFGAVALSQPPTGESFAVTLAHERQHAKLSALLDLVSLLEDPGQTRWYAPWRNDPRPLRALLQGAYAHLGVTAFWRKQRHLDGGGASLRAHAEFARWRAETRKVVATLEASNTLTPCGAHFVCGMAATLDSWRDEPIPAVAAQQARAVAAAHRKKWQSQHGTIVTR